MVKPKSIALALIIGVTAAAIAIALTGCSDSPAYPSPSFGDQWDRKEMDQFIRAQNALPLDQHKRMWVEAYEKGLIDQALTQLQGSPLVTLETGDNGNLTVYRKTPVVSYEAPADVKDAWAEKQAQEVLDANDKPLTKSKR